MLKPPLGCQARKGVSKAIGEQVFLDSVDAALDVDFDVPCRRQPDPCDFAQYKKRATHPNPGSVAFVPSVAGLILAGEIVKDLLAGTGGKEHG